jgi:hypothetical protein
MEASAWERRKVHDFVRIGIFLLLAAGTSACELLGLVPAQEEEIPGTYSVEYPFAKETLILSPDHRFTQEVFVIERKETRRADGIWSLDKNGRIDLDQAYYVDDGVTRNGKHHLHPSFGKLEHRSSGIYRIRLTSKICFGAGDDLGPCRVR